MALYNVNIGSRVSYSTQVEADSEDKARRLAIENWIACEASEMEFFDTEICEI